MLSTEQAQVPAFGFDSSDFLPFSTSTFFPMQKEEKGQKSHHSKSKDELLSPEMYTKGSLLDEKDAKVPKSPLTTNSKDFETELPLFNATSYDSLLSNETQESLDYSQQSHQSGHQPLIDTLKFGDYFPMEEVPLQQGIFELNYFDSSTMATNSSEQGSFGENIWDSLYLQGSEFSNPYYLSSKAEENRNSDNINGFDLHSTSDLDLHSTSDLAFQDPNISQNILDESQSFLFSDVHSKQLKRQQLPLVQQQSSDAPLEVDSLLGVPNSLNELPQLAATASLSTFFDPDFLELSSSPYTPFTEDDNEEFEGHVEYDDESAAALDGGHDDNQNYGELQDEEEDKERKEQIPKIESFGKKSTQSEKLNIKEKLKLRSSSVPGEPKIKSEINLENNSAKKGLVGRRNSTKENDGQTKKIRAGKKTIEKPDKRREQNRLAASRCRRKKQEAFNTLKEETDQIRQVNVNLRASVIELQKTIATLKSDILNHYKECNTYKTAS